MDLTFSDLRTAGFQHLLPIIPFDATISALSKSLHGRPDMLGKIPGVLRHDGWVGMGSWQDKLASEADLAEWQGDGAGIGLRCHDVVAVDVDVLDAGLADLIELDAMTWLGIAPVRTGNAPKRLLLFALATPGSWPTKTVLGFADWNGDRHAIELLGNRQQFVVQGIHPKTKRPYQWNCNLADVGLAGLPVVTPDELHTFLDKVTATLQMFDCEVGKPSSQGHAEPRNPDDLLAPDWELLAAATAAIPNPEDTTRETFISMAHALHGATGGDPFGRELFVEWCDRWPLDQRDGEPERVYDSVRHTSLGLQWILDRARQAGFDYTAADFTAPASASTQGGTGDDQPAPLPTGNTDSFWDRWVYVNAVKRFVDLRTGDWLDKEQFNDKVGKLGDNQTASTFFMECRKPEMFADGMDYRPGDTVRMWRDKRSRLMYNAWHPGPAQAGEWDGVAHSDRALTMWHELAEHLFPIAQEREALFDWMAYLIQHPGQKPNWHPLIGGQTHGTGKDSLFAPLTRGLDHNAVTIRNSDLEDQWTWWAENVQLVVVSEVNSFERRAVMNRLKSYMATPPDTIEINKKGVPQYTVPNRFGMLMFTNNADAVAIENSDRRFFVLWTDAGFMPEAFYEEYHNLFTYSDSGAATVWRWLAARQISLNMKGRAPDTKAKEEMRLAALPAVESTVLRGIESEEGPFVRDLVTLAEIESYCRAKSPGRLPSSHKLAAHLKAVGLYHLGRIRVGNEGRQQVYACRRAATYVHIASGSGGMTAIGQLIEEQKQKAAQGAAVKDFEGSASGR